jgi:cytochrome c5
VRERRVLLGLLAAAAACGGCATAPTPEAEPTPEAAIRVEPAPAFEAGVALPEGRGRELLVASCLGCHDLSGLPLFAPFYARDSWYTLVLTMQAHGADVDNAEIEVLADYLAQHFGANAPSD